VFHPLGGFHLCEKNEGGTEETLLFCINERKPYKLIDAEEISAERAAFLLASFIQHYGIEVINVVGPRQSQAPQGYAYAYAVINLLLQGYPGVGPRFLRPRFASIFLEAHPPTPLSRCSASR
jgi:putative molybdenum carrier protein